MQQYRCAGCGESAYTAAGPLRVGACSHCGSPLVWAGAALVPALVRAGAEPAAGGLAPAADHSRNGRHSGGTPIPPA